MFKCYSSVYKFIKHHTWCSKYIKAWQIGVAEVLSCPLDNGFPFCCAEFLLGSDCPSGIKFPSILCSQMKPQGGVLDNFTFVGSVVTQLASSLSRFGGF